MIDYQIMVIIKDTCENNLNLFKLKNRIPVDGKKTQPLLIGDEKQNKMPYTIEATVQHYNLQLFLDKADKREIKKVH